MSLLAQADTPTRTARSERSSIVSGGMMQVIKLAIEPRTETGKGAAR